MAKSLINQFKNWIMNEEKDQATQEEINNEQVEETQTENTSEESISSEEQSADDKYNELNDKYLRLFSEFDNFRKRTAKEKSDLAKVASEDVMKVLLPILDDFDRAQKSFNESTDVKSLKEGVDLIYNKLFNSLKQKGLEPTEALHQEFDADIHEALTNIPAPEEKLKGKVVDVIEKGYTLNGKIIRYAKVVVGN